MATATTTTTAFSDYHNNNNNHNNTTIITPTQCRPETTTITGLMCQNKSTIT
jgi:hypothetical protein